MSAINIMVQSDIKNILRDRSLLTMVIMLFVMQALLQFGVPVVFQYFPPAAEYYNMIVAFLCIITALFPAYIFSFAMLDEKDQQLFSVIRIMPVSLDFFLLYRLLLSWLLAFVFCFYAILISNLFSYLETFTAATMIALIAPVTQALIVALSKNKIEAVTVFKFINMLWMLPVVGIILTFPGNIFLGIVPSFWIFQWFQSGHIFTWTLLVYLLLMLSYGYILFQQLKKNFI